MKFYLGTHRPHWLRLTDVPLFISARQLRGIKALPRALGPWALDSGGFSEIAMYGEWRTTPRQFVGEVRHWRDEIGNLEWVPVQDWMCEAIMLKKTGKTVEEHQSLTVWSYLTLKAIAPDLPWVPVLQGRTPDDYLRHLDQYHRALPFPLQGFRLVGVGSVCRRQAMESALEVLRPLHAAGLKLHGFGFKINGLRNGGANLLASADSMAWSRGARYRPPMAGHLHKACNNCMPYAMRWREQVLNSIKEGKVRYQPTLYS